MIRSATEADLPAIVALGAEMAQEAPRWRAMPYSAEKVERVVRAILAGGGLFVAEADGACVGMLGALAAEHWFSTVRIAQLVAVYVQPAHRGGRSFLGLVRAMELWATAAGVSEVLVGAHTGADDRLGAEMFARLGYEPSGANLYKVL